LCAQGLRYDKGVFDVGRRCLMDAFAL